MGVITAQKINTAIFALAAIAGMARSYRGSAQARMHHLMVYRFIHLRLSLLIAGTHELFRQASLVEAAQAMCIYAFRIVETQRQSECLAKTIGEAFQRRR